MSSSKKKKQKLGLQCNSVSGQCKSLGFLHLLHPNPSCPSLPHTAPGIKEREKGVGSKPGAGSFRSCFEDDGQRTLCKPSGFHWHSWAFSSLMHDSFVCVPLTRKPMHAPQRHANDDVQLTTQSDAPRSPSQLCLPALYMLTFKFVCRQKLIACVCEYRT